MKILYKTNFLTLYFLLAALCVNAQTSTEESEIEYYYSSIWSYGLGGASPDFYNARKTVGDRWGVYYNADAGCVVTRSEIASIEKHNEISREHLTAKFGEGWEERFNKEVEQERLLQVKMIELIKAVDYIKARNEFSKKKYGEELHIELTQRKNGIEYDVFITGWIECMGKEYRMPIYELIINSQTNEITLVSDMPAIYK